MYYAIVIFKGPHNRAFKAYLKLSDTQDILKNFSWRTNKVVLIVGEHPRAAVVKCHQERIGIKDHVASIICHRCQCDEECPPSSLFQSGRFEPLLFCLLNQIAFAPKSKSEQVFAIGVSWLTMNVRPTSGPYWELLNVVAYVSANLVKHCLDPSSKR
jgi:hypothetical protein